MVHVQRQISEKEIDCVFISSSLPRPTCDPASVRAVMGTLAKILSCLCALRVAGEDSLLTSLPSRYAKAKWTKFVDERKNDETLHAYLKAPKKDLKDERSAPAVVKVLARCRLPVRSLLETFLSKDEEVLSQWK